MENTHILVESIECSASVRLGVLEPLKYLQEKNACDVIFKKTSDITLNDIFWCDVIITVRGVEPYLNQILKIAKRLKRKIIYFLDDDLLELPPEILGHDWNEKCSNTLIKKVMPEIIKKSDFLMVVNMKLGEKYSGLYKIPYFVTDVPICLCDKTNSVIENDIVNVIYIGSKDHSNLIGGTLISAIKMILKEFNNVKFTFLGTDPNIKDVPQISFCDYIQDYDKYKEFVINGNYDIGLAIIKDEEFYKGKYYNKFLEYTSIGAAGIYSNLEPYTLIVEDKVNGLLCNNTVEDWYGTLKIAISDNTLVKKILKNAREKIINEFSYEKIGEGIIRNCPDIIKYKAPNIIPEASRKLYNENFGSFKFYKEKGWLMLREYKLAFIPFLLYKSVKIMLKIILNKIVRGK